MKTIVLDGSSLTREQIVQIARQEAACSLSPEVRARVRDSRDRIEHHVAAGHVVYGVTTGFGKLSDVQIEANDMEQLQVNLLRSHAVGVGDPFPADVVRAMLALRANALAKGYSGVQESTLDLLVSLLNHGIHPVVPSQGSLGASGDLAPLAHVALVLIGEGKAEYQGQVLTGAEALAEAGLNPVRLGAKEGLALINGTQAMTGVAVLALTEADCLGRAADLSAALSMEALRGIRTAFDETFLAVRPHPEMAVVAKRILGWLEGSERVSEQGELRVQDAYSLRFDWLHGV